MLMLVEAMEQQMTERRECVSLKAGQLVYHKDNWRNERWGIVEGRTPKGLCSVRWLAYKEYQGGRLIYPKKTKKTAIRDESTLVLIQRLPAQAWHERAWFQNFAEPFQAVLFERPSLGQYIDELHSKIEELEGWLR